MVNDKASGDCTNVQSRASFALFEVYFARCELGRRSSACCACFADETVSIELPVRVQRERFDE